MSVDYAAGLSDFDDLGVCGLDEIVEELESVREKVKVLAKMIKAANGSTVVHTGAGISTASGIPDFRGKSGVWTKLLASKQKSDTDNTVAIKSEKFDSDEQEVCTKQESSQQATIKEEDCKKESGHGNAGIVSFAQAEPTITHMTLKLLCQKCLISHIISQNVDGLFLKSNLLRKYISELHGNFFLDECPVCKARFIRDTPSETMRLTKSSRRCPRERCRGYLRDCILDWQSKIPHLELQRSQRASKSQLHILIGSTAQLVPAKTLICSSKKGKRYKLVVINLQPTQFDKEADLVIHHYSDKVMGLLADELDMIVPSYDPHEDPTRTSNGLEWKRL